MKNIIALIEAKQKSYSCLPFFQFIRDEGIDPRQRLAFAPCAAPFIMGFADLNKYALRHEPTQDKIQLILNQHTYEDDFHWQWFLEDLHKLGFDRQSSVNKSLEFLWSDTTKKSRLLTYELYKYIVDAEPIEKLIVLEAIEATADIFLHLTKQITNQLKEDTRHEYRYFGDCHADIEDSHNANSDDVSQFISNMYLSERSQEKGEELVNKVFTIFTEWTYELLAYAEANSGSQKLELKLASELCEDVAQVC